MNNPLKITALSLLCLLPGVSLACPDYLDTTMRKLASKDAINFCEAYGGKPMLIVNTASNCGYTPQFEGLEQLHRDYKDQGLVVVGFSSDDFFQEENDEADAAEVCFEKYDVSFPVMATSAVRGSDANPVFRALGEASGYPSWNFNKYLVDAEGNVIEHFGSNVGPESSKLRTAVDKVL
ncbi:glutathione peroxidase [Luminiphilus syltensis NOR5-1B]|uniref:Glutathione peroxidase n=1 Tax=Luminiphilus syltensis NOR5-1B TaxID=565045 RepID=B8KS94_9GAMM|nr:glutathione peroxidase [Luminiphilus syltensis]EED34346.1 glutathione peroxidase [Luminiphilus syltensis NOR5-1B]